MTTTTIRFDKKTRRAVCVASDRLPSVNEWLQRILAIEHPALTEAIQGVWCGRDGEARLDVPGSNSLLCVGWHNSKVEWSYLS